MASSSAAGGASAPAGAKRKRDSTKNTDRKRRQQVESVMSTIKTGFNQFCKHSWLHEMVERAVGVCSRVAFEASLLAEHHVVRCLEENITLEPLNQTFFMRAINLIASGDGPAGHASQVPPALQLSFERFQTLRPAGYQPAQREPYMKPLLEGMARNATTSFETDMRMNFLPRLKKWLRLQVDEQCQRWQIAAPKLIKSAVALMAIAATNAEGNVEELLPKFRLLAPIPDHEVEWMQALASNVRCFLPPELLPVDLHTSKTLHLYLPFLRAILIDLERHAQKIADAMVEGADVDAKGCRRRRGALTFTFLPLKKPKANFLDISNTALRAMYKAKRGRKKPLDRYPEGEAKDAAMMLELADDEELWADAFDLKRVIKGYGRRASTKTFAKSIKTDGVSVSATVSRPRAQHEIEEIDAKRAAAAAHQQACKDAKAQGLEPPPKPKMEGEEDAAEVRRLKREAQVRRARNEIAAARAKARSKARAKGGAKGGAKGRAKDTPEPRIVGLDPGKKAPYTFAVHSDEAHATLGELSGSNVHYETGSCSKTHMYNTHGFTHRKAEMDKLVEATPALAEHNATLPSPKTAHLAAFEDHAQARLAALPVLMDVHVYSKRPRNLRWKTHIRTQKAVEAMCKEITAGNPTTVVGFGDACIGHHVRGTAPVSQKRLRKCLERCAVVVDVDEFRTSKLCCACHGAMRGLEEQKVVDGVAKTVESYSVRHCQSVSCHRTLWNRDVNAAINILERLRRDLLGEPHPAVFCRGVALPDDSGAVVGEAVEEEELPSDSDSE